MPVLHVEDVPEELYRRIAELAAANAVAMSEETLRLLDEAIRLHPSASRVDIPQLLAEIRRTPIQPAPGTPDSTQLLREDRGR